MPTFSKKETKAFLSSSTECSKRAFIGPAVMSQSRPMSLGICCRTGPSFTLAPGDSNQLNTVLKHLKSPIFFSFFSFFFFPKMEISYPFQNEQGQCRHLDHHKPFGETPSVLLCRAQDTNVCFCLSLYLLPGLFTGGSEILNKRKGSTE